MAPIQITHMDCKEKVLNQPAVFARRDAAGRCICDMKILPKFI
jgi:hypothetical protein